MKNLFKKDWLIWIVLLAPFLVIAYYWNRFPEQMPTHWNAKGEVDDYSGKYFGLFLMPVLNLAIYGIFKALPYIDPKKYNYKYFEGKWHILQLVILTFIAAIAILSYFVALGYAFKMDIVAKFGVPVLMLILGNYMSSIRQNYFIGVRTPWTLANENAWIKTHRFTSKLWVATSVLMLVSYLFLPFTPILLFIYLGILILPPYIYSYLLFRKYEKKDNTNQFML